MNGLKRVCLAVALLGLIAAPASAQTNTNCISNPMGWNCTTTPPPSAPDLSGFTALANAIRARAEHTRAIDAFRQAMRAGDCTTAQALAARYGDANDQVIAGRCQTQEQKDAAEQANVASLVSAAINEGRCDDAKRIALEASNLQFADIAQRVCVPKAK